MAEIDDLKMILRNADISCITDAKSYTEQRFRFTDCIIFINGLERRIKEIREQAIKEYVEAVVAELEKEYDLADKEKARCMEENLLQYDEAKGYARGIDTAISIVRGKE